MTAAKPPHETDPQEVEELARTLAAEHEEVENAKTQIFVETQVDKEAGRQSLTLSLPAPYLDRGEVGRGGMGAVRRAFDDDLQRLVAIKVMLPSLSNRQSLVQRFIDEARITALIDHPNIAPVYRLAKAPDGALSLVMKLIEGRSLSTYLRTLPPPPWPSDVLDSVLSIFVKVCDAVAFAHSRGVIHLDLKPDNIMLGPFGQVYVVDWGIARYRPRGEQPALLKTSSPGNASTGTPAYMSPEQALRIEPQIGERTDVFLLGGMLYEILTGQRPHAGQTVVAIITSAIRGAVIPPTERTPTRSIPSVLAAIAMKAMAPRPEDRHPSVLDLQQQVVAFQRGGERAPRRTYEKGSVVIREGEPGNEAFVIVSGRCVVTAASEGKPVILRELGPGDVFGETAVFSDEPRSATVEATETLVVRVVTGETLSQTLGLQTWAGEFVKTLADRFREADRRSRS
ncbi:MAG: protein kinase [Vicinamibacteria bacterium]|nr:protein kinase [Vicinamibacteria bacterium]